MKIKVPATSANLGPGFDSCGLALNLYLELEILEEAPSWEISHTIAGLPTDETNMIIATALTLAPEMVPHKLRMTSDIPPARGLGSSSAAIVAGIELASELGGLSFSQEEKIRIATEMEGHPDNVAPAICGDLVVAAFVDEQVTCVTHHFAPCDFVAVIPRKELLTSEGRSVLPASLPYGEAVKASAVSNVMVAALLSDDLKTAGKAMMQDKWHEPYRAELVPHLQLIRDLQPALGFHAAFLSGAGPTVLVLTAEGTGTAVAEGLRDLSLDADILQLSLDTQGVQVHA